MRRMTYLGVYIECKPRILVSEEPHQQCSNSECYNHTTERTTNFKFCALCGSPVELITVSRSAYEQPDPDLKRDLSHELTLTCRLSRTELHPHYWLPSPASEALLDEDTRDPEDRNIYATEVSLNKILDCFKTFLHRSPDDRTMSRLKEHYGPENVQVKFGLVEYAY